MPHVDSGYRCLVDHFESGKSEPMCIECKICEQWIRPEDMEDPSVNCFAINDAVSVMEDRED